MNVKMEEAPALAALRVHLAKIAEMSSRLAQAAGAADDWRQSLKGYLGEMPNLAELEKAESDAMAAAALGEANSASVEKASAVLATARAVAAELEPKIKTARSTIAGLERRETETRIALAELEAEGPGKMLAYLKEEIEAESDRYVKAASTLIRHHLRLRSLGYLAIDVGLQPYRSGCDLKLEIGRMDWPQAFEGKQVIHNPKLLFGNDQSAVQGNSLFARNEELARLENELGFSFKKIADKHKERA